MTQPTEPPTATDLLRVLDLIQEEHDYQPKFFKANYELHAPRLLEIAQSLRAELEQTRQQIEDAHCRLRLISDRLETVTLDVDPTGFAGDIGPWLDGPLHPSHLANYRAAADAVARFESAAARPSA